MNNNLTTQYQTNKRSEQFKIFNEYGDFFSNKSPYLFITIEVSRNNIEDETFRILWETLEYMLNCQFLGSNWKRDSTLTDNKRFWSVFCKEIGNKSNRPHFHGVIFAPETIKRNKKDFEDWLDFFIEVYWKELFSTYEGGELEAYQLSPQLKNQLPTTPEIDLRAKLDTSQCGTNAKLQPPEIDIQYVTSPKGAVFYSLKDLLKDKDLEFNNLIFTTPPTKGFTHDDYRRLDLENRRSQGLKYGTN